MGRGHLPLGRRERGKEAKRERIMTAARELFAAHGVSGVTTQQIARRADVAIGTLYLYASTKAELLIMVQNEKFAAAIDDGLATANATAGHGALEPVLALVRPVVECMREHIENGRTYLHELVFGDPAEPYRRAGLALAGRLEDGVTGLLTRDERIGATDAATLARVITAIIHISTTATMYRHRSDEAVLADIRDQIHATLTPHQRAAPPLTPRAGHRTPRQRDTS
ncbi:TetR/AcrR family transcriptional regulator [Streptomyces sp. WI04-05B]|uniref:TetR/AcrR family transcriptional regulator n=1 Tax=Streptomyces TaxID=1883 RepID=UPI0029BF550A|nr:MULTISPECIES: TetR/AcrR family transcriptional regulator [unclassified Streptomyces]MDX2543649.1 TetR/AcrR family transcriptional regulator [Streptomyces sp. WI04-05B]MDX2582863.1 TetR/AcrR family transcriptional regulator [Streptomyces sp. WI04-05A]MDX3746822.1 TetR/AcrR family transcriptional regulator [Streptomyces sp. AK08-02]